MVPSAIAWSAALNNSSMARSRPALPSFGLKRIGSVSDLSPGMSILRNFSISEFFRIGSGSLSCRQLSGLGATRFPSEPSVSVVEVINSSRMGSMGGLVTCAKSCLK